MTNGLARRLRRLVGCRGLGRLRALLHLAEVVLVRIVVLPRQLLLDQRIVVRVQELDRDALAGRGKTENRRHQGGDRRRQ